MAETNSVARSLHDLGLAAWFGGSLMGAVGLNGASEEVDAPTERAQVADAGWARWTPVNAAGIAAHLLGDLGILRANRGRVSQQGEVLEPMYKPWSSTTAVPPPPGFGGLHQHRL